MAMSKFIKTNFKKNQFIQSFKFHLLKQLIFEMGFCHLPPTKNKQWYIIKSGRTTTTKYYCYTWVIVAMIYHPPQSERLSTVHGPIKQDGHVSLWEIFINSHAYRVIREERREVCTLTLVTGSATGRNPHPERDIFILLYSKKPYIPKVILYSF